MNFEGALQLSEPVIHFGEVIFQLTVLQCYFPRRPGRFQKALFALRRPGGWRVRRPNLDRSLEQAGFQVVQHAGNFRPLLPVGARGRQFAFEVADVAILVGGHTPVLSNVQEELAEG